MHRARRYSIWLVPEGPAYRRLATIVARLSRRMGTPCFEPHVTLAGGIRLPPAVARDCLVELGARVGRLQVQLNGARWGRASFRCVFVDAARTRALIRAHTTAKRTFRLRSPVRYRPHLSLLYGEPTIHERRVLAREVGHRAQLTFQAAKVHLVLTEGPVSSWRRVATVPLI